MSEEMIFRASFRLPRSTSRTTRASVPYCSSGEFNQDQYKRLQIRKTIDEHLDKELRLRLKEIKVLSLFFIDRVANYRSYDEDGNSVKGKYAVLGTYNPDWAVLVERAWISLQVVVELKGHKAEY